MLQSVEGSYDSGSGTYDPDSDDSLLGFGVLLFVGAYVFGVVTAGLNTASYNAELRTQLGLQAALAPTGDGRGATLALSQTF